MNKLSDYREVLIIVLIVWIIGLLSIFLDYFGYESISKGLKNFLIFIAIWLAYRSNKIINSKKRNTFNSMFDEPKSEIKDDNYKNSKENQ